jgi:hypothetical protein
MGCCGGAWELSSSVAFDCFFDPLGEALDLGFGGAFGDRLQQFGQSLRGAVMDDVEPVDGLGEAQVGVDAGDHDARVDGQDLDPDQ